MYKLEEHSQQGLDKDGRKQRWQLKTDQNGVEVRPNASIWMHRCRLNQSQGQDSVTCHILLVAVVLHVTDCYNCIIIVQRNSSITHLHPSHTVLNAISQVNPG